MKTFYIMDSFILPHAANHLFFVKKFANGFKYNGYKIKIISNIKEVKDPGFVMISNHSIYQSFGGKNKKGNILRLIPDLIMRIDILNFFDYLSKLIQKYYIKKLGKMAVKHKVTILAWSWEKDKEFFDKNNIPVIFVGEYHFGVPYTAKSWYTFSKNNKNVFPIQFAADIDPKNIKRYDKKDIILSYVGNRSYETNIYSKFIGKDNYKIVPTPPYISEDERIDIYKRSKFSLGFHSQSNIRNKVVTERVFEALAYGCICLTDNPSAVKATDGNAIFIKSADEINTVIKNLMNNKKRYLELVDNGYKFAIMKGNYMFIASELIKLVNI